MKFWTVFAFAFVTVVSSRASYAQLESTAFDATMDSKERAKKFIADNGKRIEAAISTKFKQAYQQDISNFSIKPELGFGFSMHVKAEFDVSSVHYRCEVKIPLSDDQGTSLSDCKMSVAPSVQGPLSLE